MRRGERRPIDSDPPPPSYLIGRVRHPDENGPARLLLDGSWCGHGELLYRVYDVQVGDTRVFRVRLPTQDNEDVSPTAVEIAFEDGTGEPFLLYDSRKHPASLYFYEPFVNEHPKFGEDFTCSECGGNTFLLAIGFEIPGDSAGPDDVSWFVLAARCIRCGWEDVVFEDETA